MFSPSRLSIPITFTFAVVLLFVHVNLSAQKISISNASAHEGGNIQFVLTLDHAVANSFTVGVSFQQGIAQGNGKDFASVIQTIKFAGTANESQTVTVVTTDDDIAEGDENFSVALFTTALGLDVSSTATGTIIDNDVAQITIDDARVSEGEEINFELTLDKNVKRGFTVAVNLSDGTAVGIVTGVKKSRSLGDYKSGTYYVVFEGKANEKKEITVQTNIDFTAAEPEEYFNVAMSMDPALPYVDVSSTARGIIVDVTDCLHCPSKHFLDTVEQLHLTFYGDGNLQKTVQSSDKIAATTGIGVHVDKYFKSLPKQKFGPWYRAELMAQINVASSVDTISAQMRQINDSATSVIANVTSFGNSMMTPLNSGQAVDLKLRLFNKRTVFGFLSGVEFRYIGSNRNWKLNKDTIGQINTNLARVILFHDLIPYHKRNNYSVMLRAGYASNWVRGNLGSKANDLTRKRFIGTTDRTFHGVEFGVGFRLKNILADFAYTILTDHNNIPGLTGSQLVMTIKFIGGFKIQLE
jgi:hypothetical protein